MDHWVWGDAATGWASTFPSGSLLIAAAEPTSSPELALLMKRGTRQYLGFLRSLIWAVDDDPLAINLGHQWVIQPELDSINAERQAGSLVVMANSMAIVFPSSVAGRTPIARDVVTGEPADEPALIFNRWSIWGSRADLARPPIAVLGIERPAAI